MRIKHPVNAKSTPRMLTVLPPSFKMVEDKNSNGYKYTNILFGVEIDELSDRYKNLYDSLFLDTFDLSEEGNVYEVELSGSPDSFGYLNSDGIRIKLTDADEFYNGEPTRLTYLEEYSIPQHNSILGLNYFRSDPRGSGYFILSYDIEEASGYQSNIETARYLYLDNIGTRVGQSGFFTGIATQDYDNAGSDEILQPIDPIILSGRYPEKREVLVSGTMREIDHYEPYRGWTYDSNGNIVAVNDYFQDYYFDEDGEKIFHRSYLNNPFGAGNYNKQYIRLRHIPISGTLKVFDMDVLDISGNATEIQSSGTNVYYLRYSGMQDGDEGGYEPVYKGYDEYVPSGRGFNYIEGQKADLLTTTSWSYQREGSRLDPESGVWIEPASGDITNMISITNPQSRYVVEYKWQRYNKTKYISSFEANRYLSLDTSQPAYSIDNLSGNISQIDYQFTKNPKYKSNLEGKLIDQRAQILTFDGWRYRPKSRVKEVHLKVPIVYTSLSRLDRTHVAYKYDPIGYSADLVPQVSSLKTTAVNCPFDNAAPGYNAIEDDLTGNGNFCRYSVSGSNKLFKMPYNSWYGKKLIYFNGDSYYYIDMAGKSFIKANTFYKFKFRPLKPQNMTLLELFEDSLDKYHVITIDKNGIINIEIDGYNFVAKTALTMDSGDKEVIVRYYPDDLTATIPSVELFIKDQLYHYEVIDLFRQNVEAQTVSSTYLHLFKSCSAEIDQFQIYYEAF